MPATITKAKTEAPVVSAPEQILPQAVARCHRAADALENMYELRIVFANEGGIVPGQKLFLSIERYVAALAEEPDLPWPRNTWPLLEKSIELAKSIYSGLPNWRESISGDVLKAITALHEHLDSVQNPRPATPPKVIELEGIEELDKLPGMSAAQIAVIYSWMTPDGQPDVSKVRACRAGEVAAPRYQTIAPPIVRMPHLGLIDSLAREFVDSANLAEGLVADAITTHRDNPEETDE